MKPILRIGSLGWLLAVIVLNLFSISVLSQSIIVFEYDQAGNRTSRIVTDETDSQDSIKAEINATSDISIPDFIKLSDSEISIDVGDIKVYPNPSRNLVSIESDNLMDIQGENIQLINTNGILLYERQISDRIHTINISDLPNGVYILRIGKGIRSNYWKIIKY